MLLIDLGKEERLKQPLLLRKSTEYLLFVVLFESQFNNRHWIDVGEICFAFHIAEIKILMVAPVSSKNSNPKNFGSDFGDNSFEEH